MDDRTPSVGSDRASSAARAPRATSFAEAVPRGLTPPDGMSLEPTVVLAPGEEQHAWSGSAAVLTAGERTRLVLAGEVDASMNDELATCTTEITRLNGPLDVDVRNVTFMDSSVLAVLARLTQRLNEPVRVIGASESVRFLLELTHLSEVVELHDEFPDGDGVTG
ncbi:STAS domain-containing protein [Georgenia sp. EYE_87]|uniref:STAS domain-containing protein n=1 Tax=Georgenia sp. EYE_87 TaxID=2853448 RepID=UPI002006481A|nr:STAS domain-containing protein [Georgenia sp. EYE_87]MCK6209645.1 STAS domain-containing protein [Georgenia sp. EYE_87]